LWKAPSPVPAQLLAQRNGTAASSPTTSSGTLSRVDLWPEVMISDPPTAGVHQDEWGKFAGLMNARNATSLKKCMQWMKKSRATAAVCAIANERETSASTTATHGLKQMNGPCAKARGHHFFTSVVCVLFVMNKRRSIL